MSTTSRPRMKSQSVIAKCQVEIVDLKGSYIRGPERRRLQSSTGPNSAVSRSLPHAIFVARGLRQPSSKARHFTCCLACISGR
jgi:hypothetical protein